MDNELPFQLEVDELSVLMTLGGACEGHLATVMPEGEKLWGGQW